MNKVICKMAQKVQPSDKECESARPKAKLVVIKDEFNEDNT
jgi:hypothetical protein